MLVLSALCSKHRNTYCICSAHSRYMLSTCSAHSRHMLSMFSTLGTCHFPGPTKMTLANPQSTSTSMVVLLPNTSRLPSPSKSSSKSGEASSSSARASTEVLLWQQEERLSLSLHDLASCSPRRPSSSTSRVRRESSSFVAHKMFG